MKVFMSFADEHKNRGCIVMNVKANSPKQMVLAAIQKSILLKQNPGPDTTVQAQHIPDDAPIPNSYMNRLLNEKEVKHLHKLARESGRFQQAGIQTNYCHKHSPKCIICNDKDN